MTDDRVSELYYGRIMASATQEACRQRIHWMCSQAIGQDVLDVGCSEGIASILLGRDGFNVTGIDVDAAAIDYARNDLENQTANVKQNVSFETVSLDGLTSPDESFDSILLGEILEHQTQPQRMLKTVHRLLRPDGRIIITVPFGVHPHPEHVQTFYISNFIALIAPFFSIDQLCILDRYLCITAAGKSTSQKNKSSIANDTAHLLKISEEAFNYIEEKHDQQREAGTKRIERLQEDLDGARGVNKQAEQAIQAIARNIQAFCDDIAQRTHSSHRRDSAGHDNPQLTAALAQTRKTALQLLTRGATQPDTIAEMAVTLQRLHTDLADAQRCEIDGVRRRAQQEAERLKAKLQRTNEQAVHWKGECERRMAEVRYRLGDALVRACTCPKDFAALPFRIIKLFVDGLARRRERRLFEQDDLQPSRRPITPDTGDAAQQTSTRQTLTHAATAPRLTFTPVQHPQREPRSPVKAAAIMDEFTSECFRDECHLIPIKPDDWKDRIEAEKPDFLFVESAWKGNALSWHKLIEKADDPDKGHLLELVQGCKKKGIPTVFWNKEDPPNFRHFIFAASHFDYIFTTDEACIPRYREHVEHDHVYAMPFAAQPTIHHPIGSGGDRPGTVCFAGTWYNQKHADRRADMDTLLRPALRHGLHIYDRMHGFALNDNYRFPDEYQHAIQGSLTYPEMVDAYKKYRIFLNVNSVKNSPTMFSRRVLELLACGTAVISNWSLAIEQLLGPNSVAMADTPDEIAAWLEALLENDHLRDQMVLRGQRRIFTEHTYQLRLQQILETIGLSSNKPTHRIAVVACASDTAEANSVIDSYTRQAFEHKSLVLALKGHQADADGIRQRLSQVPHASCLIVDDTSSTGECLNKAIRQSSATHVSVFTADAFYGRHFLTDLMSAFVYADADIVGKAAYFTYNDKQNRLLVHSPRQEHTFVQHIPAGAMLARHDIFDKIGFSHDDAGLGAFAQSCTTAGLKLYAADRFNYATTPSDVDGRVSTRTVALVTDFRPYVDV